MFNICIVRLRHLELAFLRASYGSGSLEKHFCSGNAATSLLLGRCATSAGYKRNAAWLHPLMIAHLSSLQQPKRGDLGILLMDFAGIDVIFATRMHSTPLKVEEKAIIDAIIKCNF